MPTRLTNSSLAESAVNFKLVHAAPGEIVYLAGLHGDDASWSFIRRGPIGHPPDPAIARLIDCVATLAWADQQLDAELPTRPVRYDFGPDPYARYRR
jgi:hypothetical protein